MKPQPLEEEPRKGQGRPPGDHLIGSEPMDFLVAVRLEPSVGRRMDLLVGRDGFAGTGPGKGRAAWLRGLIERELTNRGV